MAGLKDKIRKAIKGLKEDDAMLLKWEMIKVFIETHEITKKNLKEAREAAQFIEKFERFSNGSFNIEWGDPYCMKYLEKGCTGCPISEYGGGSCNEPSILSKKVVIIGPTEPIIESNGNKYPAFLNPYGNLTSQFDWYLAYGVGDHFLKDHKRYVSQKEALLHVIDRIIDFLNNAIEYTHEIQRNDRTI